MSAERILISERLSNDLLNDAIRLQSKPTVGPRPPSGLRRPPLAKTIGPYHLLEEIGEGAMGIVYLAQQKEPIRRRVALKIMKTGLDTKEAVTRFQAERQALALLDHPGIAKIYDAGTAPDGRLYFVMELFNGIPHITEFCDRHSLSVRDRLQVFVQVCDAVEHAHQRRDHRPRPQALEHPGSPRRPGTDSESDRLRGRQGNQPHPHNEDTVHRGWTSHWNTGLHESGAGGQDYRGH